MNNLIKITLHFNNEQTVVNAIKSFLESNNMEVPLDNSVLAMVQGLIPDETFNLQESSTKFAGFWEITRPFTYRTYMEDWFDYIAPYLENYSNIIIASGDIVDQGNIIDGVVYWSDETGESWNSLVGVHPDGQRRWYVTADLQGGSFGMDRLYTAQEWLEQAADWLDSDGAFDDDDTIDDFYAEWEPIINENPQELIDYISNYWELELVEQGVDGHDFYSEPHDDDEY